MANQEEQLAILKQGVETWNQWRKEHPTIRPNLSNVDLSGANLSGADLEDLDLIVANLSFANLHFANLHFANLSGADLSNVDLSGADLGVTDLNGANLSGADLSHAIIGQTSFGDRDFREIKGLESITHRARSPLSINAIYLSEGDIPEAFIRGTGAPDIFIDYMHALVSKPIEYYSCFISYSSKDEAFAKRLYANLQSNNVRCWFAPEDLKWGKKIRTGIDEAILLHDKLLLILSRHSVASGWVEHEVKTALARERKEKQAILFPVRVDKAVLESPLSWATEIRHEHNIGDFTHWKHHESYQKAFDRLLRDLKVETQKMGSRDATTNDR